MRDFDMHQQQQHHGHPFGRHRMAKPIVFGAALVIILSVLVMTLWNAILPDLTGVNALGFWQALGLLVLCRILFGGLGLRPGMFGMARDRRRMHERWMHMTPEQREEFIKYRREGFARRGHHGRGHHDHCGSRDVHGRRDEAPRQQDSHDTQTPDTE